MGPFRTRRLTLDPIGPADEAAIVAFHDDRRVTDMLLDTAPDTPELARVFVAWSRWLGRQGLGVVAARRHDQEDIVGLFTLTPFEGTDDVELGGKLSRSAWGRDLATEAGAALIAHAFDTIGRAELMSAHHPDNRSVPATLHRLGFMPATPVVVGGLSVPAMRLHVDDWRRQGEEPLPRRPNRFD